MDQATARPGIPAGPRRRHHRWVAGVAGALTLGALGAGLGGRLAWGTATDLPSDRAAVEIAQPLVPGTRLRVPDRRHEPAFGYDPAEQGVRALLLGDGDYNGGYVAFRVEPPGRNVTGAAGVARQALVKDNWTVSTRPPDLPGQVDGVTAVRGDLVLQVYQEGADALTLEIGRREPAPAGPMVALGCLAGLALGWAGMRRAVAGTPVQAVTAWAGVALLAPCTLLTFPIAVTMYVAPPAQPVASWDIYTATGFRLLANLGVALLLVSAATALVGHRRSLPG
jgi:hypothetical protein